ncbi:hypothetical protein GALMADRAFT_730844 [Galerina marginata CBS 339.88]|uniref:Uncharacterized protein n=1 Tax=Galerina marginata (strain CBS 339.88) TaxID=685588 RepID=A0A067STG3_GALM3|nr:hypothetical protein GALMADRAFT_730844 [Galerina marginata CBS 339.88]
MVQVVDILYLPCSKRLGFFGWSTEVLCHIRSRPSSLLHSRCQRALFKSSAIRVCVAVVFQVIQPLALRQATSEVANVRFLHDLPGLRFKADLLSPLPTWRTFV